MSALSIPGIVHIAIGLFAIGAGIRAFWRYGGITGATPAGCVYLLMTTLTCLTGFFMFSSGEFTKAHALGLVTLAVTAIAVSARAARPFGKASLAVETLAYSMTFFFHMIPAIRETATRLPAGAPLVANPEAPILKVLTGAMLLLFVMGAAWQLHRLKEVARLAPAASARTLS